MKETTAIAIDQSPVSQAQRYLTNRRNGSRPTPELEAAWTAFFSLYSQKIRKFAFACGATEEHIPDCMQEVWVELLLRLPQFQLDSGRGTFDTWLFHIVRGKAVNLLRSHNRSHLQDSGGALMSTPDGHPSPAQSVEDREVLAMACAQLRTKMSDCNYRILNMRLLEERPVPEVAAKLGLTREQVWYRFHRARKEIEQIGSEITRSTLPAGRRPDEKHDQTKESAQGDARRAVSRINLAGSLAQQGGHGVDCVFQRVELGRRDLPPEWKVEWNCESSPCPELYIRKMAIVAYVEICGTGDFVNNHWPRIVNAAIYAGVAAGIATIIATPTAALAVFRTEFHKHFQGKGNVGLDENIQVALSARQEPSGPWCLCRE